MSERPPEPRTAVMMVAEAMWAGADGTVQRIPARMEDRSPGGACLRLGMPVAVGTHLVIETRRERFSGATRYCRPEGWDYVIGVQKDKVMLPIVDQTIAVAPPEPKVEKRDDPPLPEKTAQPLAPNPPQDDCKMSTTITEDKIDSIRPTVPPVQVSSVPAMTSRVDQPTEERAAKVVKVRKPMRSKLLELAHWRTKTESAGEECGGTSAALKDEVSSASSPQSFRLPSVTVTNFEAELLPVEDIYRTAGVMHVRHGIHRVVEMLRSEHLQGLSKEMKRAAVLVALDAAGITVDQVLQDCKVRQSALDSYEAGQKKQVETEWARKADENIRIEAELERIKSHYLARIARNLESIEREKTTFANWLTKKQEESQSIAEAADLFVKTPAAEPMASAATAKS